MASPYIGEVRCFGFNFAPQGWALCNGQLLPIANFNALFAVIGTIYGGDGQTTFALPNLQGRVPMHWGNGPGGFTTSIGQVQGTEQYTLATSEMTAHNHTITAMQVPAGGIVERTNTPSATTYLSDSQNPNFAWNSAPPALDAPFSGKAITIQGSSQPHENRQPLLVINFCIALDGIFPSRN
jgi:microcystin-dependent protein